MYLYPHLNVCIELGNQGKKEEIVCNAKLAGRRVLGGLCCGEGAIRDSLGVLRFGVIVMGENGLIIR